MRVALYARYSSEQQNSRSADDQLNVLRTLCGLKAWTVVVEHKDEAKSGATALNRPGFQALMEGVEANAFDLILCEAMDRLSRDQADTAYLYKKVSFRGIAIETVSEGRISELHVGFTGAMNQLFLKQLGEKTKRGLQARVKAGFSAGGRCYGYTSPQTGVLEIDPDQAAVVQRIFRMYAENVSPRQIAKALNQEGIPGPSGGEWTASAINGDRRAQDGPLHQELYVGMRVFNRRTYRKHPDTGKRSSVLNPPEQWLREPVPALRIIDDELWAAVQGRKGALADKPAHARRRPKRLLSGLLTCGCCGGAMTAMGERYGCSARRERGTCTNGQTVATEKLETELLAGIRDHLLTPEAIEAGVRAYQEEARSSQLAALKRRSGWEKELADVDGRINRALDMYERSTIDLERLEERVAGLEARCKELKALIAQAEEPSPLTIHPNAAEHYRAMIERLGEALTGTDAAEAREALRGLLEMVTLYPGEQKSGYRLEIYGRLGALMSKTPAAAQANGHVKMGAGTGFEPVTFRL
jgi:site-specific DNA recombinase